MTSSLKPLIRLLTKFVFRYIRWSSTKFVQIMMILWFFMILWIINGFPLNDISSETTGPIKLKFRMVVCKYIGWSTIRFVQIMVILWFFMILWIFDGFPLKDISSETTCPIELKFCMQVPSVGPLPSLFKSWWFCDSSWFCESFNVFL